jgi:hypothetical protein
MARTWIHEGNIPTSAAYGYDFLYRVLWGAPPLVTLQ